MRFYMKMDLKIWEMSLIVALVVAVLWGALLGGRQQELAEQLVRLHVVASSNDATDQALKYEVRDHVYAAVLPLLDGAYDRAMAEARLEVHLAEIQQVANAALSERGEAETARATLTWDRFPTRAYGGFTLPAGSYRALRVEIGAAQGENWWCVVFPPLCLDAARGSDALATSGLGTAEVLLIDSSASGYALRFRTLEIVDEVRALFGR